MHTLYIYDNEDLENKEPIDVITGRSNEECEKIAYVNYGDPDKFFWSYSKNNIE